MQRKTEEITLADVVICPSQFVYDSLPPEIRTVKQCIVAEFGSPEAPPTSGKNERQHDHGSQGRLRLLFAGSMSQRKGLADLFQAMKILKRQDVELVVMGSPVVSMDFYLKQFPNFTYEPPRPHSKVLELMQSCHVLVLPSIVEGRALVQQEAMICGLPIIVTANAGGSDLIEQGKTGFLVKPGAPEELAEKINWFADHREEIEAMGEQARLKALQVTWDAYREKILDVILR
jgi:glycosyltransferase involved in cell wall biosynthesis